MRSRKKEPDPIKQRLRICLIGTYPPRVCGIGTFTFDLRQSLCESQEGAQANVIAITNPENNHRYADEVAFASRQNRVADYRLAAEYINSSGADVVSLQHEFGIFGGRYGRYITELLKNLRAPLVTTLHTVLSKPKKAQRDTLIRIADASEHLVVLNRRAIPILRGVYGVCENKISLIHHGVPDVSFVDLNNYKEKFGVEGRLTVLTLGLLHRNKGIELMLEALPDLARAHPEIVYIVLGATHPGVKQRHGEEYRHFLQRRVRELGLEEHVIFHDRYVSLEELCEFIGACDIYVTPYPLKEQMVSGALAYAVGMGKAIVSTPYYYAEEMLSDGRGRLVDFGDIKGLTKTILELIESDVERHQMRKRAYEYGRAMTWREVARRYLDVFDHVAVAR